MYAWLKRELIHILPVFAFFFIAFSLINMTDTLMMKRELGSSFSFGQIVVAALVLAKIFLLIDHLPIINAFSNRPLIYKISWKTGLYFFTSLIARVEILLTPYYLHADNPSLQNFLQGFNWPRFWAVQIWFLVLIFQFVVARELNQVIGRAKIRKIFLGF